MKDINKTSILAWIIVTALICYVPTFANEIIETKNSNIAKTKQLEQDNSQVSPMINTTEVDASQATQRLLTQEKIKPQTTAENKSTVSADGSIMVTQEKISDNTSIIDKRQHARFNINNLSHPIHIEKTSKINQLIDISRGGIAIEHNNSIKIGDILPVHITYKDLDINTNIKIVSTTSSRAGAEFTDLNEDTANQLLYLSVLLESDNNMITNRINN